MKSESNKLAVRGELALIAMVIMNSAGVLLMLHSGSGISAISSVPYGFNRCSPADARHMDIHVSGPAGAGIDAAAPEVHAQLPVQLCGRLCVRQIDGS